MINPSYYKSRNTLQEKSISYFPPRALALVVESTPYTIADGETIYDIARRLFGVEGQYLWTIISDINPPRLPDDWQSGEVILLPKIVVQESTT